MDSAALFYTVQLLLHDVAFVQDYGARFPRELFPKGPLQALAVLGREQAGDYRQATSKSVLDIALAGGWDPGRYGTTPEEMGRVYLDLRSAFPIDGDGRARADHSDLSTSGGSGYHGFLPYNPTRARGVRERAALRSGQT